MLNRVFHKPHSVPLDLSKISKYDTLNTIISRTLTPASHSKNDSLLEVEKEVYLYLFIRPLFKQEIKNYPKKWERHRRTRFV